MNRLDETWMVADLNHQKQPGLFKFYKKDATNPIYKNKLFIISVILLSNLLKHALESVMPST